MSTSKLLSGIFILILFALTVLFSVNNVTVLALSLYILSNIILILWVKSVMGNYTNMSLFFVVFSTLYGVSGPINCVWGDGLHPIFSTPYNTDAFLISYAIANLGLIIGIMVYNLSNHKSRLHLSIIENSLNKLNTNGEKILNMGLFFAFFASMFEVINLLRIGGVSILFQGKAIYHSLISELALTLPSFDIIVVAFSLIGLYMGLVYKENGKKKYLNTKIILFFICSAPYLLITAILGGRSILLTLFICSFIGITYFRPLKNLKPKVLIIVAIIYVFMAFIYTNRAIVSLIPDDPNLFIEMAFNKQRLIDALNPGDSEFGVALGNYSEFYSKYNSDFIPKFGETYVKGLVMPIPSFLYPGSKPKQITYEFRDEFFISEASRGSIAGTGFSSILEAYINFKYSGVFFVYLIIGYFLQKIDKVYRDKNLFFVVLYIASFSLTVSFHRNAFGDIFSSVFLKALLIYPIISILKVDRRFK